MQVGVGAWRGGRGKRLLSSPSHGSLPMCNTEQEAPGGCSTGPEPQFLLCKIVLWRPQPSQRNSSQGVHYLTLSCFLAEWRTMNRRQSPGFYEGPYSPQGSYLDQTELKIAQRKQSSIKPNTFFTSVAVKNNGILFRYLSTLPFTNLYLISSSLLLIKKKTRYYGLSVQM